MVFIGLEIWEQGQKKGKVVHINTKYIKTVSETDMVVTLDDNTRYRISDESLDVFLAAIYAEDD